MFKTCYNKFMKFFCITKKKTNDSDKITRKNIDSAFRRRASEIESLRLYDRGEKKITPSVLTRSTKRV
jgi:hypothetical protein